MKKNQNRTNPHQYENVGGVPHLLPAEDDGEDEGVADDAEDHDGGEDHGHGEGDDRLEAVLRAGHLVAGGEGGEAGVEGDRVQLRII